VKRPPLDPSVKLCRDDLESGRMRALYMEALGGKGHALDDYQLSESLTQTLAAKPKGAGWWVFGYGSLLWNPLFPFAEARPAMLRGLHRRFCL
jgi:cation transport protein ChaC